MLKLKSSPLFSEITEKKLCPDDISLVWFQIWTALPSIQWGFSAGWAASLVLLGQSSSASRIPWSSVHSSHPALLIPFSIRRSPSGDRSAHSESTSSLQAFVKLRLELCRKKKRMKIVCDLHPLTIVEFTSLLSWLLCICTNWCTHTHTSITKGRWKSNLL